MIVWLTEIWRAWRASVRKPGFLVLAVCVLALGVGASATTFTLIDQTLLRPLPFAQPDRLVAIGATAGRRGLVVNGERPFRNLASVRGIATAGLMGFGASRVNMLVDGRPQLVDALAVGHRLLPTLGVPLAIGRNFTADEDREHGPPAVIVSHGFWERAYGANTSVIGRSLSVKGVAHTIVGVLPASYEGFCQRFAGGCDLLLPAGAHGIGTSRMIARLAPGATLPVLRAQIDARMTQVWASVSPAQRPGFAAMELSSTLKAQSRATLLLFLAVGLCVLAIAWVNLTNLLFAHALSRRHDGAVRAALGASASRRQLPAVAESLLIGLAGGLLGIGLTAIGLALFAHFVPAEWLGGSALHVVGVTWVFALVAAEACAVSATLLGLWRGHRVDLGNELHEGGRSGADPRMRLIGRGLVVIQVALATTLLVGTGVFLHTLVDSARTPLGFNPQGILTFGLTPVKSQYADADAVLALTQRLRARIGALPGVTQVDVATQLPADLGRIGMNMVRAAGSSKPFLAHTAGISAGHFTMLSVPLLKGRVFNHSDQKGSARVAIVTAAFAHAHLGAQPLGKVLRFGMRHPALLRVVGVVGNTHLLGPLQKAGAFPMLYVPLDQLPANRLTGGQLHVALRVRGDPNAYRKAVRAAVAEIAPLQPITRMHTLTDMVAGTTSHLRLLLLLIGVFGLLALLLATAGLYAVMTVSVASREHELGVRVALGARPARLVRWVLRGGLLQILIGLVVGIGGAVALSRTLRALLPYIRHRGALDPGTLVGVCAVLALAGLLACLLPALRAGRVQPMHALRGE